MFDINLTKLAITNVEEAQAFNRHLSRLMTDIAKGRGYVVLQGASPVSVVSLQEGERKVVKVYPLPLMEVARYTKDEADKRAQALGGASYRVVKFREAIAIQGEALAAYRGELHKFQEETCSSTGMELN